MTDEKVPEAEPPKAATPKKAPPPKTPEDALAEAVGQLATGLRNVGTLFLQVLAGTGVQRGQDVMDSILGPIEEGNSKKKPKAKARPPKPKAP